MNDDSSRKRIPVSLRLVVVAGYTLAALCFAYAVVLLLGLFTLPSPDHQIQNPWFTLMEILILAISPTMVAFTVALHALVAVERKPFAILGVTFMSMCAALTCTVHFTVLTLSRLPAFASAEWAPLVFSFNWPSLVYALDILAWDVFFPLGALFAALALRIRGPERLARGVLLFSAALGFLGLAGVPLANMNIRNIGIIGYGLLFPIAAVLIAVTFTREASQSAA